MRRILSVVLGLFLVAGVWLLRAAYSYDFTSNFASQSWTGWSNSNNAMKFQTTPQSYVGASGQHPSWNLPAEVWSTSMVNSCMPYYFVACAEMKMGVRWDPDGQPGVAGIMVGTTEGRYTIRVNNVGNTYGFSTITVGHLLTGEIWDTNVASIVVQLTSATNALRVVVNRKSIYVYLDDVVKLSLVGQLDEFENFTGEWGVVGTKTPQWDGQGSYVPNYTILTDAAKGPLDQNSPNAIPNGNISKAVYTNHIDIQWPAASDDTNGIGILKVELFKGTSLLTSNSGGAGSYADYGIVPNRTYDYSIKVTDQHFNESTTSFSVTTPQIQTEEPYPSTTPEGRRTGIRSTGAYWGAAPESIDVMSGNLNYSKPLIAAQARGGMGVNFGFNYNSQNWRWDGGAATNWRFGRDIGYGWGWRLTAGSITPVFTDQYTVHHYVFTDSTGAEYILDQQSGGAWTSKESIYLSWYPSIYRLNFKDGSFWVFDCTSAEGQPDQGVLYPTRMQDSNGNQITVSYHSPGPWSNSSGRIDKIDDIKNTNSNQKSYNFTYNSDSPIPHLISISSGSTVSPSVSYSFSYSSSQSVVSPFNSGNAQTTKYLSGVTALGRSETFTYNSFGELTQIQLPAGGKLGYDYVTMTYPSGMKVREVQYRRLFKDYNGSTSTVYTFSHESSTSGAIHQWTKLDDAGSIGQKYWEFGQSSVSTGLVTKYEGRDVSSGTVVKVRNEYTWILDQAGKNSYISAVLTTKDPGQTYSVQSKNEQIVDNSGNVTQTKVYDYNSLSTPIRTDNFTYGVFNRVTSGPDFTIQYDGLGWSGEDTSGYRLWDQGMKGNGTRGNPTTVTKFGKSVYITYFANGLQKAVTTDGVASNTAYNVAQNYALPTAMSVGGTTDFNQTMSYSGFMPTGSTDANGASIGIGYLGDGRPSSTTSPFGATTSLTYNINGTSAQVVNKTQTASRWTKSTMDGLGRTIKTEIGNDTNGVLSVVDTEYDSCGCSPLGKLKRTSLPHAPSASPVWTTYTYDGIGRTLTTTTVGTETTTQTTYLYEGNTVKVTDAAGKWKKYVTNILGQLKQVIEPDPANPGSSTYVTNYTYDALGHLTVVSMPRPTGTQTRTFTYTNELLTSVTQPENGATSYAYNADKSLVRKVDAKNQATEYIYDPYNRPLMVKRGAYGTINGFNLGVSFTPNANVTLTVGGDAFRAWGSGQPVSETFMIPAVSSFKFSSTAVLSNPSFTLNGQTVSHSYNQTSNPTVYHYTVYTSGISYTTGPGITEDPCQRETYTYDTAPNGKGRLATVAYKGGYTSWASPTCDTTFTELYEYSVPGAITKKTLRIKRGSSNNLDMVSTYTYNNEGQLTGMTYPSSWNGSTWSPGPSRSVQYDLMGRPKKLINAATSADLVTTTTYGVMGEILTMNGPGMDSETREYNSIGQMTRLVAGWQDVKYYYPSTGNNGKITKEDRKWSSQPTETVEYQYDSLNRLTSAVSTDNPGWGQSFSYDGFGNLTNVSTVKGSPPNLSALYNPATNRRYSDCADANGNISPCGQTYTWDVSNRITAISPSGGGTVRYSYDTANRRILRGPLTSTDPVSDELTYYSPSGAKMATYRLYVLSSNLYAEPMETFDYFNGRKLGGAADRLGSYGRYYPYGQDRPANPTNPTNGTEKFATYRRDSETGLDYAVNRYHAPGDGRFLSPDPYQASAGPSDPGSWNRYAYTRGDPVNRIDPSGLADHEGYCDVYGNADPRACNPLFCLMVPWACAYFGFNEPPQVVIVDPPQSGGNPNVDAQVKVQPPSAQQRFNALSEDCQKGLKTSLGGRGVIAATYMAAVDRATAQQAVLESAAAKYGLDWRLLAAVAMRESGFTNAVEPGGGGRGFFQIDITKNLNVTQAQAMNLTWSADWAAARLASNMRILQSRYDADHLLQATAASYNMGTLPKNLTGNPNTIDVGTAHNNYGSNVIDLMKCF